MTIQNGMLDSIEKHDMSRLVLYVRATMDINEPLIKEGNLAGATPLHFAAAVGAPEAIKYLVSCGANVNATMRNGIPILGFAKNKEIQELLQSMGAIDPNLK